MFNSQTLHGGERAVLLFHGLASSPLELQLLARGLNRAGYTVYLPHLSGYGDDGRGNKRHVTPWRDWVAQALCIFDRVHAEHGRVVIGGLCMGATLALQVASQRPREVAALVALSVTLWHDGWALPWYSALLPLAALAPRSLRSVFSYREGPPYGVKDERMRAWIAREMANTQSSAAGAATITFDSLLEARRLFQATRKILDRVETPALIIHAVDDEMSSPRNAEYLARHLASRRTRLVMLRDSYHMITLDQEKEQVLSETRGFLAQFLDEPSMAAASTGKVVPLLNTAR
jgi:carboxylesterase